MPLFHALPIMPKENRNPAADSASTTAAPYNLTSASGSRNAAIWSSADDEILLTARASGLNWQPIASRHFPNKTANACRKRHERLMERRHIGDWDASKLEFLAQEYMACRREMWEMLASRLGERWGVVEAKCMEKGLKTLQTAARTAHRKAAVDAQDRGTDPHSDSGVGLSDTEMEAGPTAASPAKASSWHAHPTPPLAYQEHARSRSLPQALRLYQPPPPVIPARRTFEGVAITRSPDDIYFEGQPPTRRCTPDSHNGRGGISIQSVLSD